MATPLRTMVALPATCSMRPMAGWSEVCWPAWAYWPGARGPASESSVGFFSALEIAGDQEGLAGFADDFQVGAVALEVAVEQQMRVRNGDQAVAAGFADSCVRRAREIECRLVGRNPSPMQHSAPP
jgi:hypothetical protein